MEEIEDPFDDVVAHGFFLAGQAGSAACRPVHLLMALALGGGGPVREVLDGVGVEGPGGEVWTGGVSASLLCSQAQGAAFALAGEEGQMPAPAHLLLVLVDQADREVFDVLAAAGVDPVGVRAVALDLLGLPAGRGRVGLPLLPAAGRAGQPILEVSELDDRAWAALRWRQDRLPLPAVKTARDWRRLRQVEADAAGRLYEELGLGRDQEVSLREHHLRRVQILGHHAHPELVADPAEPMTRGPDGHSVSGGPAVSGGFVISYRGRRRERWLPAGWGTWLSNRQAGIARRWERADTAVFAFRTRRWYG